MPKSYQEIRPSQFITTFGPGSIVETPGGPVVLKTMSALFNGIGRRPDEFEVIDDRLSQGVLEDGRICRIPTNAELGLPADNPIYPTLQFPYWSLCAQHRRKQILYKAGEGCPECDIPVRWQRHEKAGREAIRFVLACQNGHLDEVPWNHLVHYGSKPCGSEHYLWYGGGRALRLVRIECPKCKASANFGEAYGRSWRCRGREPENGPAPEEYHCPQPASIVQRGSANLRMAQLATALTILDMPARLHDILTGRGLQAKIEILQEMGHLSHENVISQAKKAKVTDENIAYLEGTPWETIRLAIEQLSEPRPSSPGSLQDAELQYLRNAAAHGAPAVPQRTGAVPLFEVKQADVRTVTGSNGSMRFRITPVSRLRMVMVQTGYRRLSPDGGRVVPTHFPMSGHNWYPGVELFGEGIFVDLEGDQLTLRGDRVAPWLQRYTTGTSMEGVVSHPVHVWWHSLSHRLLWALSADSGYSSAAIRERVYTRIENGQVVGSGLLLYTVQPGGDGTMGGMISLVNRFGHVLERALRDVRTCSNDPLCEEAPGQGADGAACYSCLFASETSCEHRNHGLDRLLLTSNLP